MQVKFELTLYLLSPYNFGSSYKSEHVIYYILLKTTENNLLFLFTFKLG